MGRFLVMTGSVCRMIFSMPSMEAVDLLFGLHRLRLSVRGTCHSEQYFDLRLIQNHVNPKRHRGRSWRTSLSFFVLKAECRTCLRYTHVESAPLATRVTLSTFGLTSRFEEELRGKNDEIFSGGEFLPDGCDSSVLRGLKASPCAGYGRRANDSTEPSETCSHA